ncbi:MAG: DUF4296 domain-containing protein [Polaribacter sp.]|mgnify:FL=1|nr:DUF4296 domain-containing protein [Polaribacter sp.]MDG1992975.1 DUF4296 domain-containing protein [Polaribacter sp.]
MKKLKENAYFLTDKMKKTLLFLSIILMVSCTSNTILEKPKDLIPKDSMVLLLTDLFIAKSAFNEKNIKNQRRINYIPLVYNKYKIDSTRFETSNFYYTSKLEEYELIYNEVNEILVAKKAALEESLKDKQE